MSDEMSVPASIPTDDDGFLRRRCPRYEREFKWFAHDDGSGDAEQVDQYFCPLCGEPSPAGEWWTPKQIEYAQRSAAPEIDRILQDSIAGAFKSMKGFTYKPENDFSFGIPASDPLIEPNDMLIVEPPCHAHEPLKVPQEAAANLFCLICGSSFAV